MPATLETDRGGIPVVDLNTCVRWDDWMSWQQPSASKLKYDL